MKERSLAVHIEKFSVKDKGVLCAALNITNQMGYEVHQGLLPFINVDDALLALTQLHSKGTKWRRAANVKSKLTQLYGVTGAVMFPMFLNSRKVAKRFGAHPERGHIIQQVPKKRVTVGVRWSLPKRDFEPDDDVLVKPHVVLKCDGRDGRWLITCESRYQNHVSTYLMDWCM